MNMPATEDETDRREVEVLREKVEGEEGHTMSNRPDIGRVLTRAFAGENSESESS